MAIRYLSGVNIDSNTLFVDDANNRVGIGTASPTSELDVRGNNIGITGVAPTILIYSNTTSGGKIAFVDQNWQSQIVGDGGRLRFNIGGTTEAMRIDNNGNVGIGTTSPGSKLQVSGNISIISGYSFLVNNNDISHGLKYGYNTFASNATDGPVLYGYSAGALGTTAGSEQIALYWTSSRNVGIGTTSPSSKLHVVGPINIERTGIAVTSSIDMEGNFRYIAASGYAHTFFSQGSEMVRFYNGNVGIGTTSPGTKLEVAGRVRAATDPTFEAYNTSTNRGGFQWVDGSVMTKIFSGGSSGAAAGIIFETNTTEKMRITSAGNVGIGTINPPYKLTVAGDTYVNNANLHLNGGYGIVDAGNISYKIGFPSFGNFAFENVNVGIGTTSPAFKLDVNGNARIGAAGGAASVSIAGDGSTTGGFLYSDTNNTILSAVTAVPLIFRTTNSERMRILSNGDVAIGATYSLDHLYVSKTAGSSIAIGTGGIAGTVASPLYTSLNFRGYGDYIKGQIQSYDVSSNVVGGILTFSVQDTGATLTERMRINSAGNVGIGTTSPTAPLHVEGPSADGTPVFRVNGTTAPSSFNYAGSLMNSGLGSSRNTIFLIGKAQSNRDSGYIGFNHSGTNASNTNFLTFGLFQNDNIMNITGAGNVGIGTTSPAFKLSVSGDIHNTSGYILNRVDSKGVFTGASDDLGIYHDGTNSYISNATGELIFNNPTERMRITSAGTVGIGTTSPSSSYKLDVYGAVRIKNTSGVYIDATDYGDNSGATINILNRGTTRALRIAASTSGGWGDILLNPYGANVGIGTTDPTQALHVSGNVRVTGAYYDSNNSAGTSGQVLSSTGSGTDWVSLSEITGVDGTGTANYVAKWSDADTITNSQIRDDGTTVGIGGAPNDAKLYVDGAIQAGGKVTYKKQYSSGVDTTGVAVAGITSSSNGDSVMFEFTCSGGAGHYQKVIYSCWNASAVWYTKKVVDEGTNAFDVEASADASTITFTFKSRSGLQQYTPKIVVESNGNYNTSYL